MATVAIVVIIADISRSRPFGVPATEQVSELACLSGDGLLGRWLSGGDGGKEPRDQSGTKKMRNGNSLEVDAPFLPYRCGYIEPGDQPWTMRSFFSGVLGRHLL